MDDAVSHPVLPHLLKHSPGVFVVAHELLRAKSHHHQVYYYDDGEDEDKGTVAKEGHVAGEDVIVLVGDVEGGEESGHEHEVEVA